jgi:hypothetical protein
MREKRHAGLFPGAIEGNCALTEMPRDHLKPRANMRFGNPKEFNKAPAPPPIFKDAQN